MWPEETVHFPLDVSWWCKMISLINNLPDFPPNLSQKQPKCFLKSSVSSPRPMTKLTMKGFCFGEESANCRKGKMKTQCSCDLVTLVHALFKKEFLSLPRIDFFTYDHPNQKSKMVLNVLGGTKISDVYFLFNDEPYLIFRCKTVIQFSKHRS